MKHRNLLHRKNLKTSEIKFIKISAGQIVKVFSFIRDMIRRKRWKKTNKMIERKRLKHLDRVHKRVKCIRGVE